MLATCIANDWPTETYLEADHPLQVRIRRTIEDLAREPIAAVGVDGCGAPVFALTLGGLARSFRAMVLAEPGTPERKVADAMRKFPSWTSGTTRDENRLMTDIPGLLLKSGAEGVDAFALPDGTAAAMKIEDGNPRARTPVTVAILAMLGAQPPVGLATADVARRRRAGRGDPRDQAGVASLAAAARAGRADRHSRGRNVAVPSRNVVA